MAPAATSQIGIETELRPAAHTSALRRGQLNQSTGSCTNQTEAWETCMTINGTCGYKSDRNRDGAATGRPHFCSSTGPAEPINRIMHKSNGGLGNVHDHQWHLRLQVRGASTLHIIYCRIRPAVCIPMQRHYCQGGLSIHSKVALEVRREPILRSEERR